MNNNGILGRLDHFAILAFSIPLFIYLLTLAPTVTFFDSGEFLTAIASLGVAHSPGYPLFINYAKPFTFLPIGSIALRVNFATAVSAALACYGVYLLTVKFLEGEETSWQGRFRGLPVKLSALAAAVTFACTARLWLQSNHDKPYPLLAFICAVVFYLMLLWRESFLSGDERPAYVYLGAFLCGLGAGAHQIMVLMIPTYAFLLWSADHRVILRFKEFFIAFAFGVLGFGIHLHLVVRAFQHPVLNWGDSKNLEQFLWNILRKGYPTEKPNRDLNLLWSQLNAFNVPYEFTVVGMALLIIGLGYLCFKKRELVLGYLIALGSFLAVIVGYFNTPGELIFLTEEFFTPLYCLSAVFIGVGLFTLLKEAAQRLPDSAPLRLALLVLLFMLPVNIFARNFVENDQHENYIAFDYASNTLRSLPQNAVMYTWGDSGAFPLWYLQGVERMREDLDLPHTPHLVFDWYLDSMPRMFKGSQLYKLPMDYRSPDNTLLTSVSEQYNRRPVFVDFSTKYSIDFKNFVLHQRGITFRLDNPAVPQSPPDLDSWPIYSLRGVLGDHDMFFRDLDTGKAILIYAAALIESGQTRLRMGQKEAAVRDLQIAAAISPENKPQIDAILKASGVQ
ncbi:DUF2723 domain-containing protein [Geomonas paludis]|uniref:DUF2723 domain-containing protein n=1 Tax=Geomonas paludis TaxID=2740185 RepID=A0A6V8MYY2_9BACT|nr:DUF2723 domain-containing protein [Geomonas paludis]UPU34403.1 DUF2723 domain-containing protein [Geomonas paludis]GFO64389.1 membrane protein [Geomonas paludis]